jgi:hypothetical protein
LSEVDVQLGEGLGQPQPAPQVQAQRWRGRRWWWLAAGAIAVVAVTAVVLIQRSWATAHQPITWGCCEEQPSGAGIRAVNTFGFYREDFYVPPQPGAFTFFATISNNGSRPVRIENVTIGQTYNALRPAGPVRYSRGIPPTRTTAAAQHLPVLHEVTLGPGRELFLAITLRTWPCAMNSGWDVDPSFYLTERSLLFARTVAVPWSMDGGALIMRPSGGRRPGVRGSHCVARQGR